MATTRGERLRTAREKFFKSARVAAKALGMPVSTYGAHERAEDPGGRDYGPDEAKRYARRFRVTPEWLLTGRKVGPTDGVGEPDGPEDPPAPKVPVAGYVGAGAEAHFYAVAQGDLDEVDAPEGSTKETVAVEIRGDSLGTFFDRWLVFYDDVRSRVHGQFNLVSQAEPPITDATVDWAARVKSMTPR